MIIILKNNNNNNYAKQERITTASRSARLFLRETKKARDEDSSWLWVKKRYLKKETEGAGSSNGNILTKA